MAATPCSPVQVLLAIDAQVRQGAWLYMRLLIGYCCFARQYSTDHHEDAEPPPDDGMDSINRGVQ